MEKRKGMLDIFSGPDRRRVELEGGAHRAFIESEDWRVTTVDLNQRDGWDFKPDIEKDILELEPSDFPRTDYEVVWASPPCPNFSVAQIGNNWTEGNLPKKKDAVDAVYLVYRTLWLIQELNPRYWFLENPRGKLRTILPVDPAGTVTYCQYGFAWQKPTDLWGSHPPNMEYLKCGKGMNCHQSAPRGWDSGVQSSHVRDPVKRSAVPGELSHAILEAVENPGDRNIQSRLDKNI